jgi:hypothetical protein
MGNAGFAEKKDRLAKSLLAINREIGAAPAWTEQSIQDRGIVLATQAASIWSIESPAA